MLLTSVRIEDVVNSRALIPLSSRLFLAALLGETKTQAKSTGEGNMETELWDAGLVLKFNVNKHGNMTQSSVSPVL